MRRLPQGPAWLLAAAVSVTAVVETGSSASAVDGYSDIGPGFCTANGKRPQTFLCDTTSGQLDCPPATASGCAAVCSATASCTSRRLRRGQRLHPQPTHGWQLPCSPALTVAKS